jgi:hypothetical protein
MRKTIRRRLEHLEKENLDREQKELSSLLNARAYAWRIVLAYYLGGLQSDEDSDEEDLAEAQARALKYPSGDDYFNAMLKHDMSVIARFEDAYHRLFKKVRLDFANSPRSVLFDAFVTMVNELPEKWLNSLRCDLQQWCSHAEIAPGSNLPRRLTPDNFIEFA